MNLSARLLILCTFFLVVACGPRHEEARNFAKSTELKGAAFFQELAGLCGKGYTVNHRSTSAVPTRDGWLIYSNLYLSIGAQARSIAEAQASSRMNVARYMECMFVAGKDQNVNRIEVSLDFSDIADILNPVKLGRYRMDISKLSGLQAWQEEPSFFERHRVNTFIEANMETVFEDWSQMKLE
ncbi:MAG: hypothetical protein KDK23_04180 [Leptospiraceae bacterium]|nr:hypothetical protein [Leptospiraceae bacterium]